MREIKFRVWDNDFKKIILVKEATFVDGALIGAKGINWDSKVVVMQYTGLKDKNGKEIYEGDIVKNLKYPSLAQVIWVECEPSKVGMVKGFFGEEDDLTGYISNLGEFKFKGINGTTKAFYINEFEIIGNVYENPELINA